LKKAAEKIAAEDVESPDENEEDPSPPKSPGRKRKAPAKDTPKSAKKGTTPAAKEASDGKEEAVAEEKGEEVAPQDPPKRGRGRPKKGEGAVPGKRGRGRPKKNVSA
jgi:hypothetical protein